MTPAMIKTDCPDTQLIADAMLIVDCAHTRLNGPPFAA